MNNNQNTNQQSFSIRFREWLHSFPLTTRIILIINCLLFFFDTGLFCLSTYSVTFNVFQVYRIMTNAWFHSSILHILFNMMAFLSMAPPLEKGMGTIPFAWFILMFNVLCGVTLVVLSLIAGYIFQYGGVLFQCSNGFSGIIFGLIVVHGSISGRESSSIFGFLTVPTVYYPWALLFLIQLFFPGASFFGHLSGLIVGTLYIHGFLNLLLPSPASFQKVESSPRLSSVISMSGFVATPQMQSTPFGVKNQNTPSISSVLPTLAPPSRFPGTGIALSTASNSSNSNETNEYNYYPTPSRGNNGYTPVSTQDPSESKNFPGQGYKLSS